MPFGGSFAYCLVGNERIYSPCIIYSLTPYKPPVSLGLRRFFCSRGLVGSGVGSQSQGLAGLLSLGLA